VGCVFSGFARLWLRFSAWSRHHLRMTLSSRKVRKRLVDIIHVECIHIVVEVPIIVLDSESAAQVLAVLPDLISRRSFGCERSGTVLSANEQHKKYYHGPLPMCPCRDQRAHP
jgi:hypothetical protein